jgi:hypothetical protein
MLRFCLLLISLIAIAACHSGGRSGEANTPETIFLSKLQPMRDAERLDYASVRQMFGAPLYTSDTFNMASHGNTITSMKGWYYLKDENSPPGTSVQLDMAWDSEKGRPSTVNWGVKEKGMDSSLRISFDPHKMCITQTILVTEWGFWDNESAYMDTDMTNRIYGDHDFSVSFDFSPDEKCALNATVDWQDSRAKWVTPSDTTASDSEFVTKLLPADTSGKQLFPLGFHCELDVSQSPDSNEMSCGCDPEQQTNKGPCHHAVSYFPEPNGDIKTRVYVLRNEAANRPDH